MATKKENIFYMAFLIFCICFWTLVTSLTDDDSGYTNICEQQESCRKCITSSPQCIWCSKENYASGRCNLKETHIANGCNEFKDPQHEVIFIENEQVREGSKTVKPIVMQPQKIHIRARPHESVEIPFTFYQTKDSAVDMFFLIDISKTMEQYITELANVSLHLVENLQNMTDSLKVGAGVFVEKPLLPFVFASGNPDNTDIWKKIVTYKIVAKLTHRAQTFKDTIKHLHSLTTNNADFPEAGLEALLQTAVCEENVGWRKESRRIIIYCSDAPFHYAGDGMLVGVIHPNDGQCHMNQSQYLAAETQDYPSIQQISNALSSKQVTTIFAVASKQYIHLYNKLSRKIESSYVSELNSETSSIADIITNCYKNISSTVKMAVLNKGVNITFYANCDGKNWIKSKICEGIKHSHEVQFKAILTTGDCSQKQNQTITINPNGIRGKMDIVVELLCHCDCEEVHNSSQCNERGTEKCGDCTCNSGFTGSVCECTLEDSLNSGNGTEKCKMDNSTEICSNRGECICGKCICDHKTSNKMNFYRGKFCECDDFSCPLFDRKLCGGQSRGSCTCGKCVCTSNYTENDCSCPRNNDTCLAEDATVCSGRGNCSCGQCTCDSNFGYKGQTCEVPPVCLNRCTVKRSCILCAKTNNASMCQKECDDIPFDRVDSLKKDSKTCKIVNDQCVIQYQCEIENGKELLKILKHEQCTKSNKTVLIIAIIGGILCVGIALLILWKVVSVSMDYREMGRFKRERKDAIWNTQMSPIFKPATTEHVNPAFKKME